MLEAAVHTIATSIAVGVPQTAARTRELKGGNHGALEDLGELFEVLFGDDLERNLERLAHPRNDTENAAEMADEHSADLFIERAALRVARCLRDRSDTPSQDQCLSNDRAAAPLNGDRLHPCVVLRVLCTQEALDGVLVLG